jgi:uncharacterized protein with FMN-binding domain
MRRIAIAVMTTISSLALLFSYHTSRNETSTTLAGAGLGGANGGAPSEAAPTPSARTTAAGTTYAGRTVGTQWGPVQVTIVVKNGKIVSADVLQVPMENHHDVVINTEAVPILNQAAVDQQSASFDGVSGATVTSDGYKSSLQSAIDQAHL